MWGSKSGNHRQRGVRGQLACDIVGPHMTTFWTWATIIGLAMTPSLFLGPPVAVGVGFKEHYSPWLLLPVVAAASYVEGLVFVWLAGQSRRIGFIGKWVSRMDTPRGRAFAKRWGIWGGLTLGRAIVGQEPILVAVRWMGIDTRQILFPLAVSSIVFTAMYYAIIWAGLDELMKL